MAAVLPSVPGKGFTRDLLVQHIPWSSQIGHEHTTFVCSSSVSTGLAGDLCGHQHMDLGTQVPAWPQWHTASANSLQHFGRMSPISHLYFGFFIHKYTAGAETSMETCSQQGHGDSCKPQRGRKRAPQELICVDGLPGSGEWNTGGSRQCQWLRYELPLTRKSEEFKKPKLFSTLSATKLI